MPADSEPDTMVIDPEDAVSDDTLLRDIRLAIAERDNELARSLAYRMLEDDALELLEDLSGRELSRLFAVLGDEALATLLARLDDRDAAGILIRMSADQAADVLEQIYPDDAADIFTEVANTNPTAADTILVEMDPTGAAEIQDLMTYHPDSAGGMMTPEFVAVFPELRADETVAALRKVASETEHLHYVYVVDRQEKLLGVLSLHSLVLSPPETPVIDLISPDTWSVRVDDDQEVAARIVQERDLLAIPVVDHNDRLVGVITHDDIDEILEEEATEDIERLGGSSPLVVSYMRASPLMLFRARIVWLLVLFAAQFVTVIIQEHYESILQEVVMLAVFIPILIGTGGNVGSQTVSTVIRAMAVGEAQPRHIFRIVSKEALTGLSLGLVLGLLMYGRALLTGSGDTSFAMTVGFTIVALTTWAATVGATIPIVMQRLRVDPAVVSAPFISSFVDGTGLIIYFTLARVLMGL
jgi:magnesium transporter